MAAGEAYIQANKDRPKAINIYDVINVFNSITKRAPQEDKIKALGMFLDNNYDNISKLPFAKKIIKDKAYRMASSSASPYLTDSELVNAAKGKKSRFYRGTYGDAKDLDLVEAYIYGKKLNLPKSEYTPKSSTQYNKVDNWYSIKDYIDKKQLDDWTHGELGRHLIPLELSETYDRTYYEKDNKASVLNVISDFYNDEKNQDSILSSPLRHLVEGVSEINTAKNTTSFGYDKEKKEPYISLYDIWDFSDKTGNYSLEWGYDTDKNMSKKNWQRSLMDKIGKPFGFYDRIYFSEFENGKKK